MVTQLLLLDLRDVAVAPAPGVPAPVGPAPVGRGPFAPNGSGPIPAPKAAPAPEVARAPAGSRRPAAADPAARRDAVYWRLDDHTREVGLRGVQEARRALAAAIERIATAA